MKFYIKTESFNSPDRNEDLSNDELDHLKEHVEVSYLQVKEFVENKIFNYKYKYNFYVMLPDLEHVFAVFSYSYTSNRKTVIINLKQRPTIIDNETDEEFTHERNSTNYNWFFHMVMDEIANQLHYFDLLLYNGTRDPSVEFHEI
jgi:hypothetical protein